MSPVALPPTITHPPPAERDAIADSLSRCMSGIDTNSPALFDSAFWPDAEFDLDGRVISGRDAIHAAVFDKLARLDTTHIVSNVRIHLADAKTASLSASTLAQHLRAAGGTPHDAASWMAGVLYLVHLAKDGEQEEGVWRITRFKVTFVWGQGDKSVMD